MSTRRDVAGLLQLAASHALLGHRALGRMSVSTTVAEFAEATEELVIAARGVSRAVGALSRAGVVASDRRRAFAVWFATQATDVLEAPMLREPPVVYVARAAGPVAIREVTPPEGLPIGRIAPRAKPRPEDFYFAGADDQPAIVMCAAYLDRVTRLLDQSKVTLRRLGLE